MFITGYASDVWVQRETTILQPSTETVLSTQRATVYSIQAAPVVRLTRTAASWRQDTYKTLHEVVNVKLQFELRLTAPICELFRSLLSLYDFAQQMNYFPVEARTWKSEFVDDVRTVKVWIKDQVTGEGYLHEGCAVSDCEITVQSRQIAVVAFGLVCLRSTYLDDVVNPGTLRVDVIDRPIIASPLCNVFFTTTDFVDNDMVPMSGITRSTVTITRTLNPSRFRNGSATRFAKTPAEFGCEIDTLIDSPLRSYLSTPERYGAMVVRFAQDSNYWLDVLMPSVALTYNAAQLHSPTTNPNLTINVYSIEDMTATGGAALRLYRAPENVDAGEMFDTDIYKTEGYDGGNFADNLIQPKPNLDGGSF